MIFEEFYDKFWDSFRVKSIFVVNSLFFISVVQNSFVSAAIDESGLAEELRFLLKLNLSRLDVRKNLLM